MRGSFLRLEPMSKNVWVLSKTEKMVRYL